MAQIRSIILLGHPVLRGTAAPAPVPDGTTSALAADLLATMEASGGVGIAAPQVAVGQRVIVVASRPNARYPNAPLMEPLALVNPELLWASADQEEGWEGCLSIPGLRGLVPRAAKVGVRYTDPEGAVVEREFAGFPARIFQHELDHLNGLFFTDRVTTNRNLFSEGEFLRQFT